MSNRNTTIVSGANGFGFASQPTTKLNFEVPPGACDCLTHVFGDTARYPMVPDRAYTPQLASLAELQSVLRALHVDRVVIVQTTIYGTDNSCMLDAVKQSGRSARGVAVIDGNTTKEALDEMDRAGVRGVRINLETVGITDPAVVRQRFQAAVKQIQGHAGWHIQIYTRLRVIEAIYDLVMDSPVPVSFDHFGGVQAASGISEPGFGRLLDLLRCGKVYVKVSAPELISKLGPEYPDVVPLAKALVAANPERILWASHWPHPNSWLAPGAKATDITPLRQIDDGDVFNLLPLWVPNERDLKAILVDNPARLYRF